MKKIWVNKAQTFEEADRFNKRYYSEMTVIERLETMQFLKEIYYRIKNESRKGLRRVIKVIQ